MIRFYREIAAELKQKLVSVRERKVPENQKVIYTAEAWTDVWNIFYSGMKSRGFKNENEEILFFKAIRPGFTSQIKFCSLVYSALQREPGYAGRQRLGFWNAEWHKASSIIISHAVLWMYYRKGSAHRDHELFLRNGKQEGLQPKKEDGLWTLHSEQLSILIAHHKFRKFAKKKIIEIKGCAVDNGRVSGR